MKKAGFLFGFWCLVFALSGCAQNNDLKTQLQLLQTPLGFKFSMDSTGFSKVENAKFYTKNDDTDMFDINSTNVHLIDINNDGKKDVIYQDNRHYLATVLLVKKGNDFIEIWNGSGALVYLKKGEQTTLSVLSNAIGCFDSTMLSEVVINEDNTFTENVITIHSDTKIEKIDKAFEQELISGILRTQPVIDDTKKIDPCTGESKTGNQLRMLQNKKITVIKKQSDWLLVVLKEKDIRIIGWIKA